MAFPVLNKPMSGEIQIKIDDLVIPSAFVGEIEVSVSQKTTTSSRISGETTKPSNVLDNPNASFSLFLNKWSDLQYIFPGVYTGVADSDTGSVVLGGASCEDMTARKVNFHYVCDGEDTKRDLTFPVAYLAFEDSNARNADDELSIKVNVYPQNNAQGQVVYGTMS